MELLLHLFGHFLTNCNLSALPVPVGCRWGVVCFSEGGELACTLTLGQAPDLCVSLWPGMEHSGLGRAEQFTDRQSCCGSRGPCHKTKEKGCQNKFSPFFACAVATAAEAGSGSVPSGWSRFLSKQESRVDPKEQETWLFPAVWGQTSDASFLCVRFPLHQRWHLWWFSSGPGFQDSLWIVLFSSLSWF